MAGGKGWDHDIGHVDLLEKREVHDRAGGSPAQDPGMENQGDSKQGLTACQGWQRGSCLLPGSAAAAG